MRKFHAVIVCLTAVSAVGAGCTGGSPPVASTQSTSSSVVDSPSTVTRPPDAERTYLDAALDLLQDRYFGSRELADLPWPAIRDKAHSRPEAIPSRIGAYRGIQAALHEIGDPHNRFFTPAVVGQHTTRPSQLPQAERRRGQIGYLRVPQVSAAPVQARRYARYATAAHRRLRRLLARGRQPCGWILDLRGNSGGEMYPMLLAAGPLLDTIEPVIGFLDRSGRVDDQVAYIEGRLLVDGRPATDLDHLSERLREGFTLRTSPIGSRGGSPVAVLAGHDTASAGEGVLVAFQGQDRTRMFGTPTAGIPTAPAGHRLADGALLVIAEERMRDRDGTTYRTSIPPDTRTGPAEADEAALRWLLDQPSCTG